MTRAHSAPDQLALPPRVQALFRFAAILFLRNASLQFRRSGELGSQPEKGD